MSDIIICNEPIDLISFEENGVCTIVPESNECKIGIGQTFQEAVRDFINVNMHA